MRQASHPLPFEMKGIRTDPESGHYILSENGETYYMNQLIIFHYSFFTKKDTLEYPGVCLDYFYYLKFPIGKTPGGQKNYKIPVTLKKFCL